MISANVIATILISVGIAIILYSTKSRIEIFIGNDKHHINFWIGGKCGEDWEKEFDKRFGPFNAWSYVGDPKLEKHTSPEDIKKFIRQRFQKA